MPLCAELPFVEARGFDIRERQPKVLERFSCPKKKTLHSSSPAASRVDKPRSGTYSRTPALVRSRETGEGIVPTTRMGDSVWRCHRVDDTWALCFKKK